MLSDVSYNYPVELYIQALQEAIRKRLEKSSLLTSILASNAMDEERDSTRVQDAKV
jgi:hypothetical protein